MLDNAITAVIPARGGSKGIPQKNKKKFLGRPLIEWTIEVAIESSLFDRVIVSTDDPVIAELAINNGAEVPFLRPADLAGDDVSTAEVIRHAIYWIRQEQGDIADSVMVLEPTSPGRQIQHLQSAAQLLIQPEVDSVATVVRVPHHYVADKQLTLDHHNTLTGFAGTHLRDMVHRRQDLPQLFAFDGIVFACKIKVLDRNPVTLWGDNVKGICIEDIYSVDLDEAQDWRLAEKKLSPILPNLKST